MTKVGVPLFRVLALILVVALPSMIFFLSPVAPQRPNTFEERFYDPPSAVGRGSVEVLSEIYAELVAGPKALLFFLKGQDDDQICHLAGLVDCRQIDGKRVKQIAEMALDFRKDTESYNFNWWTQHVAFASLGLSGLALIVSFLSYWKKPAQRA
jgi:hypothetical protein